MIGHRVLLALKRAFAGTRALNVLAIPAAVSDTETITIGGEVYELDTNGTITAGRIKVDISAGGTKATGTVTSNATNVTANDTVTINGQAYKFVASLTGAANEVLIGGSAADTLANLQSAVNASPGTLGVVVGLGTVANAAVTATGLTTTVLTVTAIVTGTGGNAITLAKSAATYTVSSTTLTGGVQPTGAQAVTALIAAFNTKTAQRLGAVQGTATTEMLLYSIASGPYITACTTTMAGSGNAWAAAAMYGGVGVGFPAKWTAHRSPNAQEVTDGNMYFAFTFTPLIARVSIRTSAGAVKTWDGDLTISGNVVRLDNSGSTDWAATDTVICEASE